MKKETEFTAREIILAKSEVVRLMPDYKDACSFEDFCSRYWRYNADTYANDPGYAKELDDAYAAEKREREAFNAVLDTIYRAIA